MSKEQLFDNVSEFLAAEPEQGESYDAARAGQLILDLVIEGSDKSLGHCRRLVEAVAEFSTEPGVNDTARFFNHGNPNKKAIHFAAENENPEWCELLAPYFDVYTFTQEGFRSYYVEEEYEDDDERCVTEIISTSSRFNYFFRSKPPAQHTEDNWGKRIDYHKPVKITQIGVEFSALDRAARLGYEKNTATLIRLGTYNQRMHWEINRRLLSAQVDDCQALLQDKIDTYEAVIEKERAAAAAKRAAIQVKKERVRLEKEQALEAAKAERLRIKIVAEDKALQDAVGCLYGGSSEVDSSLVRVGVNEFVGNEKWGDKLLQVITRQIDLAKPVTVAKYTQMLLHSIHILQEKSFKKTAVRGMDHVINSLWDLYQEAVGDSKDLLGTTLVSVLGFARMRGVDLSQVKSATGESLFFRAASAGNADMVRLLLEFGFSLFTRDKNPGPWVIEVITNEDLFADLVQDEKLVRRSLQALEKEGRVIGLLVLVRELFDKARVERLCQAILRQAFVHLLRLPGFSADHVVDRFGNTLLATACSQVDRVMVDLLIEHGRARYDAVNNAGKRVIDFVTDPVIFDRLFRQVHVKQKDAERYAFEKRRSSQVAKPVDACLHRSLLTALYAIAKQHAPLGSWSGIPATQAGLEAKVRAKPKSRTAQLVNLVAQVLVADEVNVTQWQLVGLGVSLIHLAKCKQAFVAAIETYKREHPELTADEITTESQLAAAGQGDAVAVSVFHPPEVNPAWRGAQPGGGGGGDGVDRPPPHNPAWAKVQ